MQVTSAMVEAAVDGYENWTGPCEQAMGSMHRRSLKAALEAALAVAAPEPPVESLEDVLAEIEEMGWEIDSLMRWKLGGQERWRVIATRPAWPGTETIARHMEDGESRLAAAIALRDAFAVRRERR